MYVLDSIHDHFRSLNDNDAALLFFPCVQNFILALIPKLSGILSEEEKLTTRTDRYYSVLL